MSGAAQIEAQKMERGAILLFEREDAVSVYLSPEEVEPWVPTALSRLRSIEAKARSGDLRESDIASEVSRALMDVVREMVPTVFTPERVGQLVADWKDYGRKLREGGESEAAMYAQAAAILLEGAINLTENPLLLFVCFASLRSAVTARARQAQANSEGADS